MHELPFDESIIPAFADKAVWDEAVPALVEAVLERWQLTAGAHFSGGEAASVLRVTDAAGRSAVLKVGYPHFEGIWEAVGLAALAPEYAPRVHRQDPAAWAMLLEEVVPGTTLSASGAPAQEALDIALDIYARASVIVPPDGVLRLEDALQNYRPSAEATLKATTPLLRSEGVWKTIIDSFADSQELLATTPRGTLLHGDLNPGNIVHSRGGADAGTHRPRHSAQSEPTEPTEPSLAKPPPALSGPAHADSGRWLLIDPKPMIGDMAFDLAPLLNQIGKTASHPHESAQLWEFTLTAAARLDIAADRIARWARFRSALDVTWYLEDQAQPEISRSLDALRSWDRVVGYAVGTRSA